MEYKTICVIFVALTILAVNANTVNVDTNPVVSDVASSELTGPAVAYLRSKRQFYPGGFGGGNSFASSSAIASSGGGGYGGFGGSNSFAAANAGAGGFGGFGKK